MQRRTSLLFMPQVLIAIALGLELKVELGDPVAVDVGVEFAIILTRCQVLLLTWSNKKEVQWDCVELFAGAGNLSRAFRQAGRRVVSFDRDMGGDSMDMCTSAGFLSQPQIAVALDDTCSSVE